MTSTQPSSTHATDTYDVVVVGARVAGAATALHLARAGLRVLVVDRSRYGSDTLSTHALMRGGVLQLHRWGLLDRVITAGTPPVRRTTFNFGPESTVVRIKPEHGVDALYAPRRTVLDPMLVDAALEAGATFRFGWAVAGVTRDRSGRVDGIAGRDEQGERFSQRARWVVGADGVRSVVASAVGAPVEQQGASASGFIYGHWSDLDTDGYEWFFTPGACAGVIPTNDGQACVFAGATPEAVGRGGADVYQRILAAASPDLAARLSRATVPALRTFSGRPGFVRRSYGPGWALVGDAGYWKDPVSAHGLTDALRDSELLGRALVTIAAAERAGAGGERLERDALSAYQATRDRVSAGVWSLTETIAAQRWTATEIPKLLLALSAAMTEENELIAQLDDPAVLAA